MNNKLKEIETTAVEEAIAKAITELTGWKYSCTVNSIQYEDAGIAKLNLTLDTSDWLNDSINRS